MRCPPMVSIDTGAPSPVMRRVAVSCHWRGLNLARSGATASMVTVAGVKGRATAAVAAFRPPSIARAAFGAFSAAAFATLVVMRNLIGVPTRNAWRIPFGGVKNLVVETIERPGNVLEYLRSESRPFYLWQMLFPVAFLLARFPWVAAISAVVLFTNVLSTYWYQFHLEYHYSFIAVPAIVIGTVVAISRFGEHYRRRLVALVAATSVWACLMWGAVPIGRLVMPTSDDPIGRDPAPTWPADHPVAVDARALMALIPEDRKSTRLNSSH